MAVNKENNGFVMLFAVGMCVVLAIALAGTFTALKGTIDENKAFDQKLNVLIAVGLHSKQTLTEAQIREIYSQEIDEPGMLEELTARHSVKSRQELEQLFENFVTGEVFEVIREETEVRRKRAGEEVIDKEVVVTGLKPADFGVDELAEREFQESQKPADQRREYRPFYTRKNSAGEAVAYCIPISGLGLWGTIYGYLALESNLDDVKGITFYEHIETPGLGGNIDVPEWQRQWTRKSILDDSGDFVSVTVKKGPVDPSVPKEAEHYVDGLSGATITSNGVTNFVREDLKTYWPHLEKLRKNG